MYRPKKVYLTSSRINKNETKLINIIVTLLKIKNKENNLLLVQLFQSYSML